MVIKSIVLGICF